MGGSPKFTDFDPETAEGEMILKDRFLTQLAGWHHRLDGHEFEQILGDSEGQGGLVCCSSWGHKESDTTE